MPSNAWAPADAQEQRDKARLYSTVVAGLSLTWTLVQLATSYQELLDEFNANDLRTVGNYSVGRLIGQGSFGKVYLATHKLTNGSKVVLKSAKKDDQNLAREIHHHRQFVHPHIARLYEVIVTENLVWLVLEFCPGDELYHHLLKHGRMPEDQVQKIFAQLVGAVSYVHNMGCVHRDLKLENILLDKHGNVKLVDFGFTREYSGTSSYLQTWCGTVCYSAPEMVKGEKYAGEKVDVWSLGVILYALLAGELPFDDDDESITKNRILKEDIVCPEYFPQGAKDLIALLLSKRPLLRPSLADILRHGWLAEHAPQQQEILKLQQPAPFTTQLEKDTLQQLRGAGVNTDTIQEHVLGQRCDGLAGWWSLLIEKEERREKRRQRRRREKEREERVLRRLSAASGRLLAAPLLREINEEEQQSSHTLNPPQSRGRRSKRSSLGAQTYARDASSATDTSRQGPSELPLVKETNTPPAVTDAPDLPPQQTFPGDEERRSTSSTHRRPAPPPKDPSAARASAHLPVGQAQPTGRFRKNRRSGGDYDAQPSVDSTYHGRKRRIYQTNLREQFGMIKAWFKDPTRRSKSYAGTESVRPSASTEPRRESEAVGASGAGGGGGPGLQRSMTAQPMGTPKQNAVRPDMQTRGATYPSRPRLSTASSGGSSVSNGSQGQVALNPDRLSLSPKPAAAVHSSYRRATGLKGRKSTSSSVSSVRSTFRVHLSHHSKASSTSSISVASPGPPSVGGTPAGPARSRDSSQSRAQSASGPPSGPSAPNTSGPGAAITKTNRRATPGSLSLGSLPTLADLNGGNVVSPFTGFGPPSPGMHPVFARQRRKVFRGPTGLGNSPRNRGKLLTRDEASEAGVHDRGHRKSRILEEEDEEDVEASGPERAEGERQETKLHQTHKRHSRVNSEDAATASEGLEDEGEEDVDAHSPRSIERALSTEFERKATHSGYFGGAIIGDDRDGVGESPSRGDGIESTQMAENGLGRGA